MTDRFLGGGDGSSPATDPATGGDWSSSHATFTEAAAAAAALGDRIFVSDQFLQVVGDTDLVAPAAHTRLEPLSMVVVDHNNTAIRRTTYNGTPGNGEINGQPNAHIRFVGNWYIRGLRIIEGDTSTHFTSGCQVKLEDCLFGYIKTTAENIQQSAGSIVFLKNTDVIFQDGNHYWQIANNNNSFIMHGGSFTHSFATPTYFFRWAGGKAGTFELEGVDFSNSNAPNELITVSGDAQLFMARLVGCNVPSAWPRMSDTSRGYLKDTYYMQEVPLWPLYESRFNDQFGEKKASTIIYRANGASDGETNYSLQFAVNSGASANGFNASTHQLAAVNAGDLSGKVLKVHYANNKRALADKDIWVEVLTSAGIYSNRVGSGMTGNTHPDESGNVDWRDGAGALTGYNEQSISISGFGTTSGISLIRVNVSEDFSTDNLFVCPKMEIS